jgi:hypothetical protein
VSSTGSAVGIFSKATGNQAAPLDWQIFFGSNNIGRGNGTTSVGYNSGSPGVTVGVWTNVAFTSAVSGSTIAYSNGSSFFSTSTGTPSISNGTSVFRIGQRIDGGTNMNGQIASTYIYNRALPSGQAAWQNAEPFSMLIPIIRRRFYGSASLTRRGNFFFFP